MISLMGHLISDDLEAEIKTNKTCENYSKILRERQIKVSAKEQKKIPAFS
jgi:hypothetical protein